MDWSSRISVDPLVCHGRVCIKGTRIMVSVILESLAAGVPVTDLLQNYPMLQLEDVQAAIAYAAELTRERVVPLTA